MNILIEVGLNVDAMRGIDYYTSETVNALAEVDSRNRYTLFSYFWGDYDRKKARLPNPKKGNFELFVRRVPVRLVNTLEWRLGLPFIQNFVVPPGKYDLYHNVAGSYLPNLRGMKKMTTHFDLAVETFPYEPGRAKPGVISSPATYGWVKGSDHVIVTAQKTRENMKLFYDVPDEKMSVIPTGINPRTWHVVEDAAKLAEVRSKYKLPARYFEIIGPYFPMWRHNAEYTLKAFAKLRGEGLAKDVKLVFVGKDSPELEQLMGLAAGLGLSDAAHKTGYVANEDLAVVHRLSQAVVHPTSVEGFGYGLEVLASGAPFITSDIPGVLESVGDAALTVPHKQVEPLAAAMKRLLAEPALGPDLRRRGVERASRYTYAGIAERLVEVYERVGRAGTPT